ncbi:type II secretion system F family protein [Anaerotalea alkaliphila]|uniref:Secretion system protein n=1 Tax=Anaerotalea alkaliphila TaxID=2662126 RepID=A0A7X5HVR6_9FIRM|nr:type II secretion system F family protein [Anaerotalea alkaliphila]NDL67331.1 secretion system protein [Anaerotalea alkaliphila]
MLFLVLAASFLAFFTIFLVLLQRVLLQSKPMDSLQHYGQDLSIPLERLHERQDLGVMERMARLVPARVLESRRGQDLGLLLVQADLGIKPAEFTVLRFVFSLLGGLLAQILFDTPVLGIVFGVVFWMLGMAFLKQKKAKRIKDFDEQINDGITVIANALKAGYSFMQALALVSDESRDPMAKEFKKLLRDMSFGKSMEESMENLQLRVPSQDLQLILNAILIQKDIGGNLSEILEKINETIRERQNINNELRALTAQGKMSGIIVSLLPVFLGLIFYVINKEYILTLFINDVGRILLGIALFNQFIGIYLISKIVKVDF